MKKVGVIIIVILSTFSIGCRKSCPKFPTNLNYFPYSEKQELKFINSQNDICYFTISKLEKSKMHYLTANYKGGCDAFSTFCIKSNQDIMSITGTLSIADNVYGNGNVSIYFYVEDGEDYNYLEKTLITNRDFPTKETYKYLDDKLTIENEDGRIIKQFVIIKNKGVVSYTTADGEEWNLIE